MPETKIETRDRLEQLASEVDASGAQLDRLSKEVAQTERAFEQNCRLMKDKREREKQRLQSEYDDAIGRGDITGADKKVQQLQTLHKELIHVAKNCLDGNGLTDLYSKQEAARLHTLRLVSRAGELTKQVKDVSNAARKALAKAGHIADSLRKADRALADRNKLAEEILSE